MAEDGNKDAATDTDGEREGGGGLLAVVLLIVALAVLVFVFRDELGIGGSPTENDIANQIDVNVH